MRRAAFPLFIDRYIARLNASPRAATAGYPIVGPWLPFPGFAVLALQIHHEFAHRIDRSPIATVERGRASGSARLLGPAPAPVA